MTSRPRADSSVPRLKSAPTSEEREKGWSAVEEYGQGMMEAGNAASTCSEEQVYAGRSVKTRS